MKLKFKILSTLLVASLPFATVISCGKKEKPNDQLLPLHKKHSYLFDKTIQDSSTNKRMFLPSLSRDRIKNLPRNLTSHYGSKLISGGYGEVRTYYTSTGTPSIHMGIDSLAPARTKLFAPADGEVINSIWRHHDDDPFATGSGGNLVIRSKIEDLNIPEMYKKKVYLKYHLRTKNVLSPSGYREEAYVYSAPKMQFIKYGKFVEPKDIFARKDATITIVNKEEYDKFLASYVPKKKTDPTQNDVVNSAKYVYFEFMHLSKNSVDLWGPATEMKISNHETWRFSNKVNKNHSPTVVKKGQLIGYVGNMSENGGWATHVHTEVYNPSIAPSSAIRLSAIHSWMVDKSMKPFFGMGTYRSNHFEKNHKSWHDFAISKNSIDPNNIFDFYNKKTESIIL